MQRGSERVDMISKGEMMPLLVEACPAFTQKWQAFLEEWHDEEDDLPHYLALADYARHLIRMLEQSETKDFPVIFQAVERLHVEGELYVKEAATIGLLESLQNSNLHTSTEPEQFRPYLGPVSLRWWDKLVGFWDRGEPLSDD